MILSLDLGRIHDIFVVQISGEAVATCNIFEGAEGVEGAVERAWSPRALICALSLDVDVIVSWQRFACNASEFRLSIPSFGQRLPSYFVFHLRQLHI